MHGEGGQTEGQRGRETNLIMGDWNYDITYIYIYSHSSTAHMKCAALCHTLIKLFKKTHVPLQW